MSNRRNPFTPNFGSMPLFFAGRHVIIDDFLMGLDAGPGEPNRATLLIGPRGSGKTALMTKIAQDASSDGWVSANVTAREGMLEDILLQGSKAGMEYLEPEAKSRLTSFGAFGFSGSRTIANPPNKNWRMQMSELLDSLADNNIGLLITVDEIDISVRELEDLVVIFQHFVREQREVALIMAGLPSKVYSVLHNDTISFLRRAVQHTIGSVESFEARDSMEKTFIEGGRIIASEVLDVAVDATQGYPFLIQLIGYHTWRQNSDSNEVSLDDVNNGVVLAQADMAARIFKAIMLELAPGNINFLVAMTMDESESRLSDVAYRAGITMGVAGQYRIRLIEQGLIESRGKGVIGFDLPMLREYLSAEYDVNRLPGIIAAKNEKRRRAANRHSKENEIRL